MAPVKSTNQPLYMQLIAAKVFTKDLADEVGLGIAAPPVTESKVVQEIKAGKKTVEFGDYYWDVLSVEGDKALLITDRIVDIRAYNDEFVDITWENCTLRKFLNDSFYNSITYSEKGQILTTHVVNNNSFWADQPGGNDTDNKIFLLSEEEAEKYFSSETDRIVWLEPQAADTLTSLYPTDEFWYQTWGWWLRGPTAFRYSAAYVTYVGGVDDLFGMHADVVDGRVRPALYISLQA